MAQIRKPIYYNAGTGEFQQFDADAGDALRVITGTSIKSGEAFPAGSFLHIDDADGKAYRAIANNDTKRNVILMALEAASAADEDIDCALPGNEVPLLGGDEGKKAWLSNIAAGQFITAPPTMNWVVELGTFIADTMFMFLPLTKVKL